MNGRFVPAAMMLTALALIMVGYTQAGQPIATPSLAAGGLMALAGALRIISNRRKRG